MYKTKKEISFLDGHTVFRGEEERTKNVIMFKVKRQKRTSSVIACYCWKEDGHLFQKFVVVWTFSSLLLLFVSVCAIFLRTARK